MIAKDLLRETLGFKGIAMTDDLDMGAIDKHFDIETAVTRILDAEIDIALICHDRLKVEKACRALLKAVRESEDTRRKAMVSVQRILHVKRKYLAEELKPKGHSLTAS